MRIRDAFAHSLAQLVLFVPRLIAALAVLAIGLLLAWLLGALGERLLRAAGADRFVERHGLRPSRKVTIARAGGLFIFWAIALAATVAAADALALPWVSLGLARVVGYLPNLLAASLILVAGFAAGNLAQRVLQRAPHWARIARGAIVVIAGFMAIEELQVAVQIVTLLFAFVVGAAAVACAVAFGIGNRELAGRITREWWERASDRRRDTSTAANIHAPVSTAQSPTEAERDDLSPPLPRH